MKDYPVRLLLVAGSISILVACAPEEQRISSGDAPCGQLYAWAFPADLTLHSLDPDSGRLELEIGATKARINLISTAAEYFCREHGRYPTDLEELSSYTPDSIRGTPCEFDTALLGDAWGSGIEYSIGANAPGIRSYGPDGRPRTDDDLNAASPADTVGIRRIDIVTECDGRRP